MGTGRGRAQAHGHRRGGHGHTGMGVRDACAMVTGMNTRMVKAHIAQVGKALRRLDTDDTHFWEGIAVGSVVIALLTLLVGW